MCSIRKLKTVPLGLISPDSSDHGPVVFGPFD
jgi:hypothetical protein